jgi:hypothetical protein
VPTPLSPDQNKRVQQLANDLIEQHRGNVSSAARSLKKNQSWLARLSQGKLGASLESASLLCHALGRNVSEVLGIVPTVSTWSEVPGFQEAQKTAREILGDIYDDRVWYQVERMVMPIPLASIDPYILVQAAHLAAMVIARTPPSVPPKKDTVGSVRRLKVGRRS